MKIKKKSLFTVFASVLLIFSTISCLESNKSVEARSNPSSQYQETIVEENTKKECYECKGAGIVNCGMCNATGINNMGVECGCIRNYNMLVQMGDSNPGTPLRKECMSCGGTGISRY